MKKEKKTDRERLKKRLNEMIKWAKANLPVEVIDKKRSYIQTEKYDWWYLGIGIIALVLHFFSVYILLKGDFLEVLDVVFRIILFFMSLFLMAFAIILFMTDKIKEIKYIR